jgi:cytochrome bd-type quinol oxidase subunit 2
MSWIVCIGIFGFWLWLARRSGNRAKELVPTGIYSSPLYWISNTLALILVALAMYLARINAAPSASPILWITAVAIIAALLFLRRTLKWRYPV